MRKSILLVLLILFSAFILQCGSDEKQNFVQKKETNFLLNGSRFKFSGANQYYLFYKSKKMVDEVIEDAAAMGLNAIRTWGFCDGESKDGFSFQPSPRQYDENGFKKLDYVIYKASQHGIRLIIPFINNWDDMGGMSQYVRWSGKSGHDLFYTDTWSKDLYKDYIQHMLTRVNTITGITYRDDPTIFIWELANEPRNQSDRSGKVFTSWVQEMASFIKSLDKNHLVSLGTEGFSADKPNGGWMYDGNEGTDFVSATSVQEVDIASVHLYPEHWGLDDKAASTWLNERLDIAKQVIKKPVYLGEFGIKDKGRRDASYDSWYSDIISKDADGILFWILSGKQDDGSLYPDYDGFTVYYPENTNTINLIKEKTSKLLGK